MSCSALSSMLSSCCKGSAAVGSFDAPVITNFAEAPVIVGSAGAVFDAYLGFDAGLGGVAGVLTTTAGCAVGVGSGFLGSACTLSDGGCFAASAVSGSTGILSLLTGAAL
jgi:hypothetical protein